MLRPDIFIAVGLNALFIVLPHKYLRVGVVSSQCTLGVVGSGSETGVVLPDGRCSTLRPRPRHRLPSHHSPT